MRELEDTISREWAHLCSFEVQHKTNAHVVGSSARAPCDVPTVAERLALLKDKAALQDFVDLHGCSESAAAQPFSLTCLETQAWKLGEKRVRQDSLTFEMVDDEDEPVLPFNFWALSEISDLAITGLRPSCPRHSGLACCTRVSS